MEIKKKAKFRVICKDILNKKHKTYTVYEDGKNMSFEEFVKKVEMKIKEI